MKIEAFGANPGQGMDRIRSLLKAAHLESKALMARREPAPEASARYTVTLHALATAAHMGLDGYAPYADAVGEQDVLDSMPKLSAAAVSELQTELEYICRHSPFESVRIAAAFYLEA